VQTKLLTADWPEGILNHSAACERLDEEEDTVIMRGLRVRMGIHAGYPKISKQDLSGRPLSQAPISIRLLK